MRARVHSPNMTPPDLVSISLVGCLETPRGHSASILLCQRKECPQTQIDWTAIDLTRKSPHFIQSGVCLGKDSKVFKTQSGGHRDSRVIKGKTKIGLISCKLFYRVLLLYALLRIAVCVCVWCWDKNNKIKDCTVCYCYVKAETTGRIWNCTNDTRSLFRSILSPENSCCWFRSGGSLWPGKVANKDGCRLLQVMGTIIQSTVRA